MRSRDVFGQLPRLSLILIFAMLVSSSTSHGCVNEQGTSKAWFAAFRIPGGRRFAIWDTEKGPFRILSDETFLQKLLEPIKLKEDKVALWNDDVPEEENSRILIDKIELIKSIQKAHDKGVLYQKKGTDKGFLFIHTVPNFPAKVDGATLNHKTPASSTYGQSMICLSINSSGEFQKIYNHLALQNSRFYFDNFGLTGQVDRSKTLTLNEKVAGSYFSLVTKSAKSPEDPFEDILTREFSTGWLTETWGRPYKDNSMASLKVVNNMEVTFEGEKFKSTKDHSKYALALNVEKLLCIGGMNHMDSQAKRGGQFVCFKNGGLYKAIKEQVFGDNHKELYKFPVKKNPGSTNNPSKGDKSEPKKDPKAEPAPQQTGISVIMSAFNLLIRFSAFLTGIVFIGF